MKFLKVLENTVSTIPIISPLLDLVHDVLHLPLQTHSLTLPTLLWGIGH